MDYNNTGRGILIDTFGNYYNGKFKDQKKNGKGLLHIRDVYFLSCKWDNDLKNDLYNHLLLTAEEETNSRRYNFINSSINNLPFFCNL